MSSSDATALLEKEAIEPAGDSRRASARYAEAVSLYATTRLTIREICALTGDSHRAFSAYLCQNHRDLILRRHGLEGLKEVKLRGAKGQSTEAYLKYHDAIAAADSVEYIDYNVSQIARIFGLDGTGLGNQLRHHYPEIIPRREKERRRLGVHDNIHRGVRPWCAQRYARAVEMLHTTDWTVDEVAETCDVTPNGLREHIACYHKELVKIREEKRLQAMRQEKVRGQRTGAWTIHKPSDERSVNMLRLSRPIGPLPGRSRRLPESIRCIMSVWGHTSANGIPSWWQRDADSRLRRNSRRPNDTRSRLRRNMPKPLNY